MTAGQHLKTPQSYPREHHKEWENTMSNGNEDRKLIVVGVDGSQLSIEALWKARHLAAVLGCSLHVVTVWEYPISLVPPVPTESLSPQVQAEHTLNDALKEAFGSDLPENLKRTAMVGQPVELLIKASRGAEMLVVGNRGHGGFVGLLLGSVSSVLAAHARCPVLIVHRSESS